MLEEDPTQDETVAVDFSRIDKDSSTFVGRWNRLVSTTNWEKGCIIDQWREALSHSGAPASEYSDEAWARRVGGVTGQHVGRLRRVYQRFGQTCEDYQDLYWSHFQAALDWDDAELWLEGATQNGWSVSQMRNQRWETLGAPEDLKPREDDIITAELDEDFEPAVNENPIPRTISGAYEDVDPGAKLSEGPDFGEESESRLPASSSSHDGASIYSNDQDGETVEFVRPFENLSELPDDLANAFEAYKLAIVRHKAENWQQISRDDVLASLDALKELVRAPAVNDAPF